MGINDLLPNGLRVKHNSMWMLPALDFRKDINEMI
jgi:hypothetical protein